MSEKGKTKKRRTLQGVIVSKKMQKTAVVKVDYWYQVPKYKKIIRKSKKFKAHLEPANLAEVGDKVLIEECRPLSKEKRWRVVKKLI